MAQASNVASQQKRKCVFHTESMLPVTCLHFDMSLGPYFWLGSDKLFQNFHLLFYSQILTPSPYYSTEGTYFSLIAEQEARQLIVQFSGV